MRYFFPFLFFLPILSFGQDHSPYQIGDTALYNEILAMDQKFFDAYNSCDIETQAAMYSDQIEFFHDKGGLSTSKAELLKATKEHICNKVTRTLLPETIEIYAIPNYGAIEIGYHTFFNKQDPNQDPIPNRFVIVWRKSDHWYLEKVISLHWR